MFFGSTYPNSRRPRRNAGRLGSLSGVPNSSTPIRAIRLPCFARATSGHPRAAPAKTVMNSRRLIDPPEETPHRCPKPSTLRRATSEKGQTIGSRRCDAMSAPGLGCVKTCTGKECAELFSLLASPDSGRQRYWFSNRQNRDGISTRKFCVGVFTQPRPISDIRPAVTLLICPDLICERDKGSEGSAALDSAGGQSGDDLTLGEHGQQKHR